MVSFDDLKNLFGSSTPDTNALPTFGSEPDPQIARDYVAKKYGLDQRNALQDQIAQENQGPNYAAAIGALGAGLSGGNAAAAGQNILENKRKDQEKRLGDFDNQAKIAEESDPNSSASKVAQGLAAQLGVNPELASNLTAARFKSLSPALEMKYKIEQDRLARQDASDTRKDIASMAREDRKRQIAEKQEEALAKLTTPYGLANTADDAKNLKEASESKNNFDNKINKLIDLRTKHNGGTNSFTNSEDVARGKQLSKDLLLEYKNMAKLGVLSKSDEDIINAIIPADPLQYNSLSETATGQDATLSNLKAFKNDSDVDFKNRVATRIRGGDTSKIANNNPPPSPGPHADLDKMTDADLDAELARLTSGAPSKNSDPNRMVSK